MLIAMILSLIFTIIDICAVINRLSASVPIGINPFWKLAFVFKLLTDSVILDDFKTALDRLSAHNISRIEVEWARGWDTAKPIVDHTENSRAFHGSNPSRARVSTGVGDEGDLIQHGPGISVTREVEVSHHSAGEADLAIPMKCIMKI